MSNTKYVFTDTFNFFADLADSVSQMSFLKGAMKSVGRARYCGMISL